MRPSIPLRSATDLHETKAKLFTFAFDQCKSLLRFSFKWKYFFSKSHEISQSFRISRVLIG